MYGHSENKKAIQPVNLILTGWNSPVFQGRLLAHSANNWGIDIYPAINWEKIENTEPKENIDHEETKENTKSCFSEIFDLKKCVYLTADSPNTLESFEEDKIYIIGGIVDKNRHKNICF